MAQIPANQKLWVMYVAQAKAKYHVWPSPTATEWVHDHYVQAGGKFVESEREVDERFRDTRYTKNKGEQVPGRPARKQIIEKKEEAEERQKKGSRNSSRKPPAKKSAKRPRKK